MRLHVAAVATLIASVALVGGTSGGSVAGQPAARATAQDDRPDLHRPHPPTLSWQLTPTGSTQRFRGLSAVSRTVAWVGGTGGTVLRTTDGGTSWSSVGPAGTDTLQFRDVEATSARHAVILSVGAGTDSRIYVTDDGGASWTESFRNTDERAFYDCMAFTTPQRGLAVSDPVDGVFRFVETTDGGRSWSPVDPAGTPPSVPNEFAFAASGTCLTAGQGRTMYLGSNAPRIYISQDRGHTWSVSVPPIVGGPSAGVFSVRFRDRNAGIAVGGDFSNPTSALGNAAWSADGGLTWAVPASYPTGYRSGSAWVPRLRDVAVAVGPSGSDVSRDAGRSWTSFDTGSFDSVECAPDGACWASGEQGRVARLAVDRR